MTLSKMLARLIANAQDAAVAGDIARQQACGDIAGLVMDAIARHGNMKLDFPG